MQSFLCRNKKKKVKDLSSLPSKQPLMLLDNKYQTQSMEKTEVIRKLNGIFIEFTDKLYNLYQMCFDFNQYSTMIITTGTTRNNFVEYSRPNG